MRIKTSWLLLFFALLTTARLTNAQYSDSSGYGGWNNPMSAMVSTRMWSCLAFRTPSDYKNGTMSCGGTTPAATPTRSSSTSQVRTQEQPSPAIDAKVLKFRPTGTYVRTKDLADALGNDPSQRDQYLKLMNAVLDAFGQKAQAAGLQNDLALALSYFLGENVRIYRGLPDLSDQQFVDLRNTIASALTSTGALNSATDRQKQEFYEALVAYTGITQFGYEEGLKAQNDAIAKAYQKVAGRNLQTVTKISPDDINIDSNASPTASSQIPTVSGSVDLNTLRQDYSENAVRADQIYKGKRFVFTGTVVEVNANYYKTTGQDTVGRPIVTNLGTNLRLSSFGAGPTVIGYEVHCFFRDESQLAQLRGQQRVSLEALVQGREEGSTTLILTDAILK